MRRWHVADFLHAAGRRAPSTTCEGPLWQPTERYGAPIFESFAMQPTQALLEAAPAPQAAPPSARRPASPGSRAHSLASAVRPGAGKTAWQMVSICQKAQLLQSQNPAAAHSERLLRKSGSGVSSAAASRVGTAAGPRPQAAEAAEEGQAPVQWSGGAEGTSAGDGETGAGTGAMAGGLHACEQARCNTRGVHLWG